METDRATQPSADEGRVIDARHIDPEGVTWSRVDEKYVTVRALGVAISGLIWLAITAVPLVLALTGVWGGYPRWLAWTLPGVALIWTLIDLLITRRRVRAIGYAERENDLLVRQGILFRKVLVVPYGRMQYVDVQMGPVDRAFGLCKVQLHTAAASVTATIPGVKAAEGARLREQLSDRGEARLAGL
ncbi:membrane protein YdbS with pleckstrin-like domain [Zhihengliuella flava]|uniref:Membrane protein YdbS with pleckstrin-like domain n=1 Tax=Zhihengliuella flava TaxID=1285193 RepID=A0A931GJ05_9MICC|nr:PH domain-containing protein [Zhihengliuella flava]MBG6084816.1 membrane protein YdbS with pleckstrin-like domain [Zhihengliuella flava]